MLMEKNEKLEAMLYAGEENGGSEIVQTVIILGFALGLGLALLLLQGMITDTMNKGATSLNEFFTRITQHVTG